MSAKRGKAFSPPLDIGLCHAYMVISQDAVVENSQTNTIFWTRILDEYTRRTSDTRTIISLQSRWRDIQKFCGKWRGYFKSVEGKNQSGQTEADKVEEANRLYHQLHGKEFQFAHCWAILQEHIKWQDVPDTTSRVKTPSTGTSSSPNFSQIPGTFVSLESDENPSPSGGSVESPRKRLPTGGKKEKEAKRKSKMSEETNRAMVNLMESFNKHSDSKEARKAAKEAAKAEMVARKLDLAERKAKAIEESTMNEKREIERKERENEMQIMNMDLSQIADPQRRQYFSLLKGEIMEKMLARQPPQPYYPDFNFTED